MAELSLEAFRIRAEQLLPEKLEAALNGGTDDVMSPEVMDQLFWSVLIGFVVNVAAGIVTPLLQRKAKKSLTSEDIAEITRVFEKAAVTVKKDISREELRAAALQAIPASVLNGRDEIAAAVADAALTAIKG